MPLATSRLLALTTDVTGKDGKAKGKVGAISPRPFLLPDRSDEGPNAAGTASNVSTPIHQLEEDFGAPPFNSDGTPIMPNDWCPLSTPVAFLLSGLKPDRLPDLLLQAANYGGIGLRSN